MAQYDEDAFGAFMDRPNEDLPGESRKDHAFRSRLDEQGNEPPFLMASGPAYDIVIKRLAKLNGDVEKQLGAAPPLLEGLTDDELAFLLSLQETIHRADIDATPGRRYFDGYSIPDKTPTPQFAKNQIEPNLNKAADLLERAEGLRNEIWRYRRDLFLDVEDVLNSWSKLDRQIRELNEGETRRLAISSLLSGSVANATAHSLASSLAYHSTYLKTNYAITNSNWIGETYFVGRRGWMWCPRHVAAPGDTNTYRASKQKQFFGLSVNDGTTADFRGTLNWETAGLSFFSQAHVSLAINASLVSELHRYTQVDNSKAFLKSDYFGSAKTLQLEVRALKAKLKALRERGGSLDFRERLESLRLRMVSDLTQGCALCKVAVDGIKDLLGWEFTLDETPTLDELLKVCRSAISFMNALAQSDRICQVNLAFTDINELSLNGVVINLEDEFKRYKDLLGDISYERLLGASWHHNGRSGKVGTGFLKVKQSDEEERFVSCSCRSFEMGGAADMSSSVALMHKPLKSVTHAKLMDLSASDFPQDSVVTLTISVLYNVSPIAEGS
ncbi:MAG: hypothetical protein ACOYKN_20270 [Pirellula sp.]